MSDILDGGSSAPLYQQVLEDIKVKIESGVYPSDSQIPTEFELAQAYGVGRVTVRRAIEELVGEGYLTKRQGRGTFVTAPKMVRKVHQKDDVQSFTDACAAAGMRAGARLVAHNVGPAGERLAAFFGIDPADELLCVSRVRTADGVPVLLENNHYPMPEYAFLMDEPLEDCSIFQLVGKRSGRYPVASDPCTLEIARATLEIAHNLSVPVGEPLFAMNVGFLDRDRVPFCFGRQFYVGSRYSFDI